MGVEKMNNFVILTDTRQQKEEHIFRNVLLFILYLSSFFDFIQLTIHF